MIIDGIEVMRQYKVFADDEYLGKLSISENWEKNYWETAPEQEKKAPELLNDHWVLGSSEKKWTLPLIHFEDMLRNVAMTCEDAEVYGHTDEFVYQRCYPPLTEEEKASCQMNYE